MQIVFSGVPTPDEAIAPEAPATCNEPGDPDGSAAPDAPAARVEPAAPDEAAAPDESAPSASTRRQPAGVARIAALQDECALHELQDAWQLAMQLCNVFRPTAGRVSAVTGKKIAGGRRAAHPSQHVLTLVYQGYVSLVVQPDARQQQERIRSEPKVAKSPSHDHTYKCALITACVR